MKEHGILFSAPMVRALLRPVDPKGLTRRTGGLDAVNARPDAYLFTGFTRRGDGATMALFKHRDGGTLAVKCPHPPGTRLWVRETTHPGETCPLYRATDGDAAILETSKWTPAIHMPRSRARIFLDVVKVRVERAQDISDDDVRAEGMDAGAVRALWDASTRKQRADADIAELVRPDLHTPHECWRIGWTLINGRASWDANPWVWVYEFRRAPDAR